jgi:class 3 adenylate cyclase
LATVVAIDAVGFSRQSEIDEALVVREIAALGERVAECAAAHRGRVFNTAGDGFMLEFPTASGALERAETLLARTRVPLRVGIHLGEVSEMPGGDLLGRGVNVAARLRELARPGALLLSGEVWRALPAPGGSGSRREA